MILLTTAANDKSLLPMFKGLAKLESITYGDFQFLGMWESGHMVWVVGERKKLGDLIQCIDDGRNVLQIQRAREAGIGHVFFILEGEFRENPKNGLVQERRGRNWKDHESHMTYNRVMMYLQELEWYGGLRVYRTKTPKETVAQVLDVYQLFQVRPEDHTGLKKIYSAPVPSTDVNLLGKRPSLRRRIAKELPGVGWEISLRAEEHFFSAHDLISSSPQAWMEIEGVGKVMAERIQAAIYETESKDG